MTPYVADVEETENVVYSIKACFQIENFKSSIHIFLTGIHNRPSKQKRFIKVAYKYMRTKSL